jgi:hypothetical protein
MTWCSGKHRDNFPFTFTSSIQCKHWVYLMPSSYWGTPSPLCTALFQLFTPEQFSVTLYPSQARFWTTKILHQQTTATAHTYKATKTRKRKCLIIRSGNNTELPTGTMKQPTHIAVKYHDLYDQIPFTPTTDDKNRGQDEWIWCPSVAKSSFNRKLTIQTTTFQYGGGAGDGFNFRNFHI